MSQFLSDPFCGYKYKLLPNDAIISKILERIEKDLEKGSEAERTKWRHIVQLELESTSDFMSRPH